MLRALCDEEAVGVYSAAWVLSENFRMLPDVLLGAAFAAGMRLYVRDRDAFGRLYGGCMLVAAALRAARRRRHSSCSRRTSSSSSTERQATTPRRRTSSGSSRAASRDVRVPGRDAAARRAEARGRHGAAARAWRSSPTIALNLLLLPRYRAMGAACATLAVSAGALIASWGISARWAHVVELGRILAVLAATAAMVTAAYAARVLAGHVGVDRGGRRCLRRPPPRVARRLLPRAARAARAPRPRRTGHRGLTRVPSRAGPALRAFLGARCAEHGAIEFSAFFRREQRSPRVSAAADMRSHPAGSAQNRATPMARR